MERRGCGGQHRRGRPNRRDRCRSPSRPDRRRSRATPHCRSYSARCRPAGPSAKPAVRRKQKPTAAGVRRLRHAAVDEHRKGRVWDRPVVFEVEGMRAESHETSYTYRPPPHDLFGRRTYLTRRTAAPSVAGRSGYDCSAPRASANRAASRVERNWFRLGRAGADAVVTGTQWERDTSAARAATNVGGGRPSRLRDPQLRKVGASRSSSTARPSSSSASSSRATSATAAPPPA
jgi:hypothetical protein